MTKTLYEFITESYGYDYNVVLVTAENVHKALIAYCKYTGEINDAFMEAIRLVDFDNAIIIANNLLQNGILDIHEVGNTIYTHPNRRIDTIEDDIV